jgi:hypothetical protein
MRYRRLLSLLKCAALGFALGARGYTSAYIMLVVQNELANGNHA